MMRFWRQGEKKQLEFPLIMLVHLLLTLAFT